VSDWAPRQQQQQQGVGSSSKEEMRALKDSLRLMAAEVALVQGRAEEASKQLKPTLARCVWGGGHLSVCRVCVGGGTPEWVSCVCVGRGGNT
jgi:hypothetical protein